jgi:site-specific DNA recombinase
VNDSFEGFLLRPRNGVVLRVLVIARISTVHQDARSLDDQVALCQRYVSDRYQGEFETTVIQGRGSGEALDRQDLVDAEAAVETGRYDLVVVEDLGRICRRNYAVYFCKPCEDSQTRLIALDDSLDTARGDWRVNAFFASFKHESANKGTSLRIRRSQRNRFQLGGVVQTFPYGYIKPPGAVSDAEVIKDPDAEPVYRQWFERLEKGASFAEVADWLNSCGVPTGVWVRSERWDGTLVGNVTRNSILKGFRRRNERKSQRVNKTGRRKSVKAPPEEHLLREVPHLAFIDPARYDRVIAALDERNAPSSRGRNQLNVRAGVPRKRTVWPGQHIVCGVCGRLFYWGGHGQADRLMCSGVRSYQCWNAATFDGDLAARRLAAAVLSIAESLPDFDEVFLAKVEAATGSRRTARNESLHRLASEIDRAKLELDNVVDAIATVKFSPALSERLSEIEGRLARLQAERADLNRESDALPHIPSVSELKRLARQEVGRLDFDNPEFGRLMHRLAPRIEVFPHIPFGGGQIVLRAVMEVNVAALLGPAGQALGDLIVRSATVDLFEPPQRIAHLDRLVQLCAQGHSAKSAASELGLTATAAQRSMVLHREMQAAGVSDPYLPVLEPPVGSGKFSRDTHARYHFEPLNGYPATSAEVLV